VFRAQIGIFAALRLFDSVTSQAARFASIPGTSNALRQMKENDDAQRKEKNAETPSPENSPVSTSKETKLGRLANQAASRAKKREQRYDQEHEIFTN
jgi:hypothetical protein